MRRAKEYASIYILAVLLALPLALLVFPVVLLAIFCAFARFALGK